MKFILGKKIGMSQVFDKEGKVMPVTVIEAGPVFVTQVKIKEKDGYEAVQVGFGSKKSVKKPQIGHIKKAGISQKFQYLREVRTSGQQPATGSQIDVSIFQEGDKVVISGLSKAKGFQGVVKRHGFAGGPASHGQKHSAREPGSIGVTGVQRVIKGTKMAGRMGGERVTSANLEVVRVDPKHNILAVGGAVPGRRGTLLEIRSR